MALQFIDRAQVVAWVIDAWQNGFETVMDPADGRWFDNGPGGDGIGLYGGLTDHLASELVFDESSKIFTPHQKIVYTPALDNRNGLAPSSSVTLTYAYTHVTTSTHATSHAIKAGIAEEIKVSAKFVESTTTFTFDYTYSWTESKAESKGETYTFSQILPVEVPEGKVYQAQLMCNSEDLTIPYKALVRISGQSEANFPGPVQGKKTWRVDAATLCRWINKYGSAGDQSCRFGPHPDRPKEGFFALEGTMTGTETVSIAAHVVDITASYTGDDGAASAVGPIVATIPLERPD